MAKRDEAARIARRIAKADRRIANGRDARRERDGIVSEREIANRLRRLQEEKP